MSEERRLRQEIAHERDELAGAVRELRAELDRAKRRIPALAAGGVVALTAVRVGLRMLRRR